MSCFIIYRKFEITKCGKKKNLRIRCLYVMINQLKRVQEMERLYEVE